MKKIVQVRTLVDFHYYSRSVLSSKRREFDIFFGPHSDIDWRPEGEPVRCSEFAGAVAINMGLWEEYCAYHRDKPETQAKIDRLLGRKK